jgi:hypothetical protein
MATPTRPHRKLRGSPEVVAKKSLTAYAHFDFIIPSPLPPLLSPKARPQPPPAPQPQRDVSTPPRMHQTSTLQNLQVDFRGRGHATPAATQTPQVQNLQGGHGHPTSSSGTSWKWISEYGHGSRHAYDDFEFSLWDVNAHDYRRPSKAEQEEISKKYNAQSIRYQWPFVIVSTLNPPKDIPLTIGGATACFVSPDTFKAGWSPLLPSGNANYANPRVNNPCPNIPLKRWTNPSPADTTEVANALLEICNVQSLKFSYPYLVVVLWEDDRRYSERSLPGMVGPWSTTYHHGGSFWDEESLAQGIRAREMVPNPDTGVQDTTNYLITGDKYLSPGVRLERRYKATTCGIRLKNPHGDIRITAANHGFLPKDNNEQPTTPDDEVWHPDGNAELIGIIKERYEAEDVALFEPIEGLSFRNSSYFDAEAPQKLLKSSEVLDGAWFEADGMSTGMVAFQCRGVQADFPMRPAGAGKIEYGHFQHKTTWAVLGAVGSRSLIDGICGAPIVELPCSQQGFSGGGVAGFFQLSAPGGLCSAPGLDYLIEKGWSMC